MKIDNRDCYWIREAHSVRGFVHETHYLCNFNKNCDGPQCKVDQLCCKYVSEDGLDDYIRMLLAEIGETK